MAKETKRLAEALAVKDEVEGFLGNLEKLKANGSIAEEQYIATREEYYERLGAAASEIARIKNELKKQLEANKREIQTYRQELANLDVRHKVGELPSNKYQSSERKLWSTIDQLELNAAELKRLIDAKSSADIGAPSAKTRIATTELPTTAKKAKPVKEVKLPKAKRPEARAPELPSLARVAPAEEGLLRPRTKIAALIGGVLLLISVFLPWIAASEKLGKELGSESGMGVSMIIGAVGIIGGLVAIGSAFFPSPKARSAVQIVMAVLALAVLPAIVLMGILPLLSEYARSLVVIREGLYIYIIAAILLIIVGSLERRHW
jgi:hypothetical protein